MIHELDTAIREYAEARVLRPPAPLGATRRGASPHRPESAGMGLRYAPGPMQCAAIGVLETTWRVWREPLA